jgi:hypothetical protein
MTGESDIGHTNQTKGELFFEIVMVLVFPIVVGILCKIYFQ